MAESAGGVRCGECGGWVEWGGALGHARAFHVGSVGGWACGTCAFQGEDLAQAVGHAFAAGHPVQELLWQAPKPLMDFLARLQASAREAVSSDSAPPPASPSALISSVSLAAAPGTPLSAPAKTAASGKARGRPRATNARWTPIHHRNIGRRRGGAAGAGAGTEEESGGFSAAETETLSSADDEGSPDAAFGQTAQPFIRPQESDSTVAEVDFEPELSLAALQESFAVSAERQPSPRQPSPMPPPAPPKAPEAPKGLGLGSEAASPGLGGDLQRASGGELHENCSRCGRSVKLRNERGVICRGFAVSHLKACLNILPWACAHCHKLFPDKFPLTKHAKKHHDDETDGAVRMVLPDKAQVEERLRQEMAHVFPIIPMDSWKGIE